MLGTTWTIASLSVPKKQAVKTAGPQRGGFEHAEVVGGVRVVQAEHLLVRTHQAQVRVSCHLAKRIHPLFPGETDRLVEKVGLLAWQVGVQGPAGLQPFLGEEEVTAAGETRDPLRVGVVDEPDGFRNRPPHQRHTLRWEARRRAARSIHHVA